MMRTGALLESAESLNGGITCLIRNKNDAEYRIKELEEDCSRIEHEMERPRCKYKERARLATQLAAARRERRALKDWLHENQPYFQWLGTDNGTKAQNMIANLIGVGRKVKTTTELRRKAREGA